MIGQGVRVAVSTTDGAHIFTSDESRKSWNDQGNILKGESVNNIASDSNGRYYAATLTDGVFISDDEGKTWNRSCNGLHVRKVWTVEPDRHEPGTVYAGTHYGHLFRSVDSGKNWEEVAGLHNAPNRNEWGVDWGFGTIGLALHTVLSDPHVRNRLYVVAAGNGSYRSDDSGESWKLIKDGTGDACPIGGKDYGFTPPEYTEEQRLAEHLRDVHSCTHKLELSSRKPGLIFQQNHCGVFYSENSGTTWEDISFDSNTRHGFPVAVTEGKHTSMFVIPAYQGDCKKHNSCIQGQLAVMRTDDSGRSWNRLVTGLPDGVHAVVLRDGMSHDSLDQPGVYFGTTAGDVFASADLGESWRTMASGLGRIQGVSVI